MSKQDQGEMGVRIPQEQIIMHDDLLRNQCLYAQDMVENRLTWQDTLRLGKHGNYDCRLPWVKVPKVQDREAPN